MDPLQSVTMLGRHSFNSTIRQEHVDHWVVLFCVDWFELCQGLWHDYRRMAGHWEKALAPAASSWHNSAVRFAEVDCAADKVLCNENGVKNYPSVIHFKGGKFEKEWEISWGATSLSADLSKWIRKELTVKLMRKEASQQHGNSTTGALVNAHLHELSALLSWKDPTTAIIGYVILAIAVAIVAWIVGTGLELEVKAVLSSWSKQAKNMPRPSALLPELPAMPEPRTIVRSSIIL